MQRQTWGISNFFPQNEDIRLGIISIGNTSRAQRETNKFMPFEAGEQLLPFMALNENIKKAQSAKVNEEVIKLNLPTKW